MSGSLFTFAAGRRAKGVIFAVWFLAIFIATGPAGLMEKFEEAENNEASSYLPGDAESTKALDATEALQGGGITPAVCSFRREAGMTEADRQTITERVRERTETRYPGVIPDGATAAAGGSQAG